MQALFSSRVRVKLLTRLFTDPGVPFYARALSRELGEYYNAVWQELNNLERIGLLVSDPAGSLKYYRLNPKFPIYEELKRIVFKTSGLGQALRQAQEDLGMVEWAFVYGSVADGEEDSLSDIDLMLIGEVDLGALSEWAASLKDRLGREISYVTLTRAELMERLAGGDPFTGNVLAGNKVMLIGDEGALRQVAGATTDQALSSQASRSGPAGSEPKT